MRNLCFRTALTVLRTTVLAGVQSQYTNNKLLFVESVATNASCSYIFFCDFNKSSGTTDRLND